MGKQRTTGSRRYPRTARLNELVREIVAEEIERIDDERLGFLTITAVEVDASLERATIYWTDLGASDEEVLEVLAEHRPRLQAEVNRQTHMRRTPILTFAADEGLRSAERVDEILRHLEHEQHEHEGQDG